MTKKLATFGLLAAASLFALQSTPAYAQGFHHGWGGRGGGYHGGGLAIGLGLGALAVGAVALATAPLRIAAECRSCTTTATRLCTACLRTTCLCATGLWIS